MLKNFTSDGLHRMSKEKKKIDGYLQSSGLRIQAFIEAQDLTFLLFLRQCCSHWSAPPLPPLVKVLVVVVLVIVVVGRFLVEALWMPLSKLPQIFCAGETCPWCSFWWSSTGVDASLLARPPPPTGGGQPCTSSAAPTSHSMLCTIAASYCKLHTAVQTLCRSAVGAANKCRVPSWTCKCSLLGSVQVFPPGQCASVASVASVPSWGSIALNLLSYIPTLQRNAMQVQ